MKFMLLISFLLGQGLLANEQVEHKNSAVERAELNGIWRGRCSKVYAPVGASLIARSKLRELKFSSDQRIVVNTYHFLDQTCNEPTRSVREELSYQVRRDAILLHGEVSSWDGIYGTHDGNQNVFIWELDEAFYRHIPVYDPVKLPIEVFHGKLLVLKNMEGVMESYSLVDFTLYGEEFLNKEGEL